ncbi:MAG: hypothetical protein EOP05_13135 [Proteobacteria bacterium]|nr:MAG: hypothetical protein EOP05_13135 [Pseudomonadota bacterium]
MQVVRSEEPIALQNPSFELKELEQKLMAFRVAEMTAKDQLISELKTASTLKSGEGFNFWKQAGHASLRDYCLQELSYTPMEVRDILIKLGQIITRDRMTSSNPEVEKRIHQLIAWRRQKALHLGIAAFRVLGNRTVLAIAELGPKDLAELGRVKGIGHVKLQVYGDAILDALA